MKPFTQGSLEYTCGLYAIINSVRIAASKHKRLPNAHWFDLYFALTEAADEKLGGTGSIIREGLTSTELQILLRATNRWMVDATGLRLIWQKPYRIGNRPEDKAYLLALREHVSAGGSAILSVSTGEEHWTCLHGVKQKSFALCDSDGLRYLPAASALRKKIGSHMTIDPTYTYLISCLPKLTSTPEQ